MTAKYPLAAKGQAFTQSQCKQVLEGMEAYFPRRARGHLDWEGEKSSRNSNLHLRIVTRIWVSFPFRESPVEMEV